MSGGMRTALAVVVAVALGTMAGPAAAWPCDESFAVDVGPGTLTLSHHAAEYNCCPGGFAYTVAQTATQILVTERSLEDLCDCICCFDLEATFDGLAAGTYELVVTYRYGSLEPPEWRTTVEIPGEGAGAPAVAGQQASDCLPMALEGRSWSALKALYR